MIRSINTWECYVSDEGPFNLYDTQPIPRQPLTLITSRSPITRVSAPVTPLFASAPASLAAEFDALVGPAEVKPKRRLRATWRAVFVASTAAYIAGTIVGSLSVGWF